jgi:hypothetical protein
MKFFKIKNQNKGFVALFAVFLTIIVLAITIGIANISYKEQLLSSSAREANTAFFAADSGAECALYYDQSAPPAGDFFNLNGTPDVKCFGDTGGVTIFGSFGLPIQDPKGRPADGKFTIDNLNTTTSSCVSIVVYKGVVDSFNNTKSTIIESKGYNFDCATVANILAMPNLLERLVERVVRVSYVTETI